MKKELLLLISHFGSLYHPTSLADNSPDFQAAEGLKALSQFLKIEFLIQI
ncbi:MAG: hypothetical protein V4608_09725 [Bacteroidota bacterium]